MRSQLDRGVGHEASPRAFFAGVAVDEIVEISANAGQPVLRGLQDRKAVSGALLLVPITGGQEQVLFVPERAVEAEPIDPHVPDQVLDRSSLVPLLPEQVGGAVQDDVRIELFRAGHVAFPYGVKFS